MQDMQKIHVSKLNGKLEDFQAISVNTLDNDFCRKMHKAKNDKIICTKCYSFNTLETKRFGTNLEKALQRNTDILSKPLDVADVPFINASYFRFDAHGELLNDTHFKNYILIAKRNRHCNFALWTKRTDIVNRVAKELDVEMPFNLILVWSNPFIDNVQWKPPKYFHYVFNNVSDDENIIYKDTLSKDFTLEEFSKGFSMSTNAIPDDHYKPCTGQKCKDCLNCYQFSNNPCVIEKVKNK